MPAGPPSGTWVGGDDIGSSTATVVAFLQPAAGGGWLFGFASSRNNYQTVYGSCTGSGGGTGYILLDCTYAATAEWGDFSGADSGSVWSGTVTRDTAAGNASGTFDLFLQPP